MPKMNQMVRLAKLAASAGRDYLNELQRLASAGELDWRYCWHGIEGTAKYAVAVASGDAASADAMAARAVGCRACPSRVPDPDHPDRLGHCGPKFQDRTRESNRPTCGCPLEGKIAVASESCAQYVWLRVSAKTPDRERNLNDRKK